MVLYFGFYTYLLFFQVLPEWSALLDSIRDMVAVDAPGERNQWRAKLVQQIRALAAIAAETNDSGARDTSERIKDLLQGYLRNPMMTVCQWHGLILDVWRLIGPCVVRHRLVHVDVGGGCQANARKY